MRNGITFAVVVVLLLSFTACDDGTTTPLPPPGNTPAQVLRSLIYAFNSRDIETLDAALAEDFTFHFDPNDVGKQVGDYTIPESWGKEEFLEAVGNLFLEAYDIQMDINTSNVGTPDEDDTTYSAQDVEVNLLDATNGFIGDGFCDFAFVNEGANGADDWVISDWWDKTGYGGTFESVGMWSLGKILAWFYVKTGT
jgi:hypothetical protein